MVMLSTLVNCSFPDLGFVHQKSLYKLARALGVQFGNKFLMVESEMALHVNSVTGTLCMLMKILVLVPLVLSTAFFKFVKQHTKGYKVV